MYILIHATNNIPSISSSLYAGVITWTGLPSGNIAIRPLLYAGFATSFAFRAMLTEQWVGRCLRNRGGPAANKGPGNSGFGKWCFQLVIESLLVVFRLALLLLRRSLSLYLRTIGRTVTGTVVAITLLGSPHMPSSIPQQHCSDYPSRYLLPFPPGPSSDT